MQVKSYLSEKVDQLFAVLPADTSPESLPSDVKVSLGKLTFIKEFELSAAQPRMGIDTQIALRDIQAQGYHLAKIKLEFKVTEQDIAPNEPTPGRNAKLPGPRTLTMITGAGTSIAFGLPSTVEFTDLIATALREDHRMSRETSALALYDSIEESLRNYLVNPGIVTFEDIYQSIQDVKTIEDIPCNPTAFDAFRPRVGATHVLNNRLSSYSDWDGLTLQRAYLNNLLDTFLEALSAIHRIDILSAALERIRKKFRVWSFTLNYDNIISDACDGFTSGFTPGDAPRVFSPAFLLSALESRDNIHSHLHGSLKWGFPIEEASSLNLDPFELHEFDRPEDGVQHSTRSRPSGRPIQSGETLPPSPIITGLSKTELVFRQPFFTNFLAFFRALNLCTDVLIAGYSFPDRHVNMGIEQFRRHRPECRTYIVDMAYHPSTYIDRLTPDAKHTIKVYDQFSAREIPQFPGWWQVPGISNGGYNTGTIFLWLRGFDTFCEDVVNHGLPEVE